LRYSIVDLPDGNSSVKRDSTYFMINQDTGELRLKLIPNEEIKFASERVDFQFWVGATDEDGLHAYVPVTVVALPEGYQASEIQPQNSTFFVKEDMPIGSLITTFRVTHMENPKFRVVSFNDEYFQVDEKGNLLTKARLDHEDKHTVS